MGIDLHFPRSNGKNHITIILSATWTIYGTTSRTSRGNVRIMGAAGACGWMGRMMNRDACDEMRGFAPPKGADSPVPIHKNSLNTTTSISSTFFICPSLVISNVASFSSETAIWRASGVLS